MRRTVLSLLPALTLAVSSCALADAGPSGAPSVNPDQGYGIELQGFKYPHNQLHFWFSSQGSNMQMNYMDVSPKGKANGQTAVLLHGKNFCGATWDDSIT
ncbi:MAG TPA: alpha/beta hydrolase, partial [Janthinobacterium sp.]|nr:alpha/beta hydrolase [Janthinobacterium sp.]